MKQAYTDLAYLDDYRDAKLKAEECKQLYEQLSARMLSQCDESEKKSQKRKTSLAFWGVVLGLLVILGIVSLYRDLTYSESNISMSFRLEEQNYVETFNNRCVFHYIVQLENHGDVDIDSVKGTVTFVNQQNEILVDTSFSFRGNPVAVRVEKSVNLIGNCHIFNPCGTRIISSRV